MTTPGRGNASLAATPLESGDVSWRDYYELTKPRVVALLVFTALVGMVLAAPPAQVPWDALVFGSVGIALGSAAAAAINQMVDRRADARMVRTSGRPIPQGKVHTLNALLFATALGVSGIGMLWVLVNPLTAVLTFLSLIGYACVYTLLLKRATPQNIVIGGAAGAAPPVLGWAAVTGTLAPEALLLFLIIFAWTPPHFWALAIHRRDEYASVGIPMLPVTHGVAYTKLQILLYTVLLIGLSLLPWATGMSGLVYLLAAVWVNVVFLRHVIKLFREDDPAQPMRTFSSSITYLMVLFAALLADHYLILLY